jgi:hypothetical protein
MGCSYCRLPGLQGDLSDQCCGLDPDLCVGSVSGITVSRVVDPDPAGSEIICMFGSGSKCSSFPTYGTVAISIKENRFKELPYVFFIVKI